jgi:hypothetical protein
MTAAGDAGRLVESVRAEHVERPAGWIGGTYEMHARCELDGCRWPCGAVQVAEALERESARAERLARALRAMEWAHTDPADYPKPEWDSCYFCDMDRQTGHASYCQMSAALGLAAQEGEQG